MRRTIKTIALFLIFMIFLMPLYAQADSFTFNVTADKTQVDPGEEVVITLNLSDIDAGELGINTVEATLSYDTNVFEEVTQEDFQSLNNWSLTYNGEDTEQKGKILGVIIASGVTEDQTIGTITLKVKEGVEYQNTTVSFTGIATNNGTDIINETDKTINLEIGTAPAEPEEPNEDNNNEINIGNTVDDDNSNTTTNTPTSDNTQSPNRLPQTGTAMFFMIAFVIIVLGILTFVGYNRYKNIDK